MEIIKNCAFCDVEFIPKHSLQLLCSNECKKAQKAKLKREKSTKPKVKNCQFCNAEFKPYTSLDKFCTAKCRIDNEKAKRSRNWTPEQCEKITGKNNPAYRNGNYRRSATRTQIGQKEFERNKKKLKQRLIDERGHLYCEHCNAGNAIKFETHHIIYRSEKPNHEQLHCIENLLHVCILCHNKFHKKKGLRNNIVEARKLHLIFGQDVLNK